MHLLLQLIVICPAVALAGWLYSLWAGDAVTRPFRSASERATEFLIWPSHR